MSELFLGISNPKELEIYLTTVIEKEHYLFA